MARRVQRAAAGPRAVDGLHVLSPLVIPLHGRRAHRARSTRGCCAPRSAAPPARSGLERPLLWSYVPQAEWLVGDAATRRRSSTTASTTSPPRRASRRPPSGRAEARFAARADLVLASAPALAERMRTLNRARPLRPQRRRHRSLRHGARGRADRRRRWPRCRARGSSSRAPWSRPSSTSTCSRASPGAARTGRSRWSARSARATRAPTSRRSAAAQRAPARRAALRERCPRSCAAPTRRSCPTRSTTLTRSVFPMKVYEYLAAGLPVVTTPLPALDATPGVVVAARRAGHGRGAGARAGRGRARRRAGRARRRCGQLVGCPARRDRLVSFRLTLRERLRPRGPPSWATRCGSTRRCARSRPLATS